LIFNPQQKPRIFEILKTQGSSINEKLVEYGISGQDARFRIAQELLMKGKEGFSKIMTRKTPYRFCIPFTAWRRFCLSDKSELYIIQCVHCSKVKEAFELFKFLDRNDCYKYGDSQNGAGEASLLLGQLTDDVSWINLSWGAFNKGFFHF
jgi:hypothetical protein